MTNKKSTKRALLLSALALLMCVSMLIGSTFAWFTDSVTSGRNKIVSGNLDIVLEYKTPDSQDEWKEVTSDTVLFGEKGLWEPGHTEVVALRIRNAGTLALKYDLATTVYEEVAGTNVYGDSFKLSDHLEIGYSAINGDGQIGDIFMGMMLGSRDNANSLTNSEFGKSVDNPYPIIMPGDAHVCALAITMPETVGNEANYKTGTDAPFISFGVTLLATQATLESDSFDDQYDKDAKYPGEVGTAAELATALANNESVKLLNNIELTGEWTPIGNKDEGIYYTGTLDGNGFTISGLSVMSGDYVALISAAKDATIKNLNVEGSVEGENAAGVVARVEGNTVIENVTSNVTVKGTTKAGGIACNVTNSEKTVFINCVNNGAVSGGNNGIGGIIGYVNNDAYAEIIACKNNANITSDNNKYAGAAVGYAAGTSKGKVVDMKNLGIITGTLLNDGRFLKYDDTVLCGYVGTIGNWTSALLATPENVQSVIDNALEDATIQLSAGKYDTIVAKSNITIQGVEGAVVDCINLNGADNVTLKGITFDAAGAKLAYDGNGNQRFYGNIISGDAGKNGKGTRNLVIDGCTFTGNFANGGTTIAFNDQGRGSGQSGNITIKGCTFETTGGYVDIYTYYSGFGEMIIEGNTFASDVLDKPIYLGKYQSSTPVVVKGNTFENAAAFADATYLQDHGSYGVSFDAVAAADNTFNG